MNHLDHIQVNKQQQQYQARMDYQDLVQFHKKDLDHVNQQTQGQQMSLNRDTCTLGDTPSRPDGTHLDPGQLVYRDLAISPYDLGRTSGPHMDQSLSGTTWTDVMSGPGLSHQQTTGQKPPAGGRF